MEIHRFFHCGFIQFYFAMHVQDSACTVCVCGCSQLYLNRANILQFQIVWVERGGMSHRFYKYSKYFVLHAIIFCVLVFLNYVCSLYLVFLATLISITNQHVCRLDYYLQLINCIYEYCRPNYSLFSLVTSNLHI